MSKTYPIGIFPAPPEDGGGFVSVVSDLPGCMSHGETQEEALKGAIEAIAEWIDEAEAQGFEVPAPGSAAQAFRQDRAALFAQLKSQKQNIEKLDTEVKTLRASIEALLDETGELDQRGVTWMQQHTIYAIAKKREHNLQ